MLDPAKVTILTPRRQTRRASLADWGIPGSILTEFLDSRRVEIARTGDYTVPRPSSRSEPRRASGARCSKISSSSNALYDTDAPLEEALPELVTKYPNRYRNTTLKEISDDMHRVMMELDPGRPGQRRLRRRLRSRSDPRTDLPEAPPPADRTHSLLGDGRTHRRRHARSLPAGHPHVHARRAPGRPG